MGKCHFSDKWLEKTDGNGYKVKDWAKKNNKDEAFCCVCLKTFSISKGFFAIEQHAQGSKHKDACNQILPPNQLRLTAVRPNECQSADNCDSNNNLKIVKIYDSKRQTTEAEIIWALKCMASNFSGASCDGLPSLLAKMAGNNENVFSQFTFSSTKFR